MVPGTSTLVFSYKPSSGQNIGTLAATGLSGGAIKDSAATSADLTNAAQTFEGLGVQTTPPSLSVTGETADVVQGASSATTLLTSDSITDPAGSGQIAKAGRLDRQRQGGRRAFDLGPFERVCRRPRDRRHRER